MASRRQPPINDMFSDMPLPDLQNYIITTTETLKQQQTMRNFVQQEREMINGYYEISRDEYHRIELEIQREESLMEQLEQDHSAEINKFINKFRHLEYDHDIFIRDILSKNSTDALKKEEEIRAKREDDYMNHKLELKKEIKEATGYNREEIDKTKEKLERRYNHTKDKLEKRLNEIVFEYRRKMKQLEEDLELRLKVEIHELEERKNLHINNLIRLFEDRMDAWKKENIEQIKENINLIKTNNDNLKALKDDNENLEKEVEELKKDITELEKQLEAAKQEHSQINTRLAKYYNQEINIENMKAKILSLRFKCEETIKKTQEIEEKKQKLIGEISDLKEKFIEAVTRFKSRAEFKNKLLDDHINQLNDTYTKREIEIEEILKEVDFVGNMGDGDMNGEENAVNMGNRSSVLNRDIYLDLLEHVKIALSTKTQIIKNLKYSLALATKAYNDTIRVYEAKLIEFGLPPEELGFQLLESNTSKMPAGLVSA